jgi:hypothetical protein
MQQDDVPLGLVAAALLAALLAWLENAYSKKRFPFNLNKEEVQAILIVNLGYFSFLGMLVALFLGVWRWFWLLAAIVTGMFIRSWSEDRAYRRK